MAAVMTVGYYDLQVGQGVAAEADLITTVGYDAVNMTSPTDLTGLDMVFAWNPSNDGYTDAWTDAQEGLRSFAADGGVVIFHDRYNGEDPFARDLTADLNFVNLSGPVADGAYGSLDNADLDGGNYSGHGAIDIDNIQDAQFAVLLTNEHANRGVTVMEAVGDGWSIQSGIPLDYWAGESPEPTMISYAENLIAYAGELRFMTHVDVDGSHAYRGDLQANDVFGTIADEQIQSGSGDDIVRADAGADFVNGGAGDDIVWGGAGADSLNGSSGNDQLWGGADADQILGGDGDDFLVGGTGADVLGGGVGGDVLLGGDGDDLLKGGDGADTLSGGEGLDHLNGGAGADVFLFTAADEGSRDVVHGFEHGQDLIDLTELLESPTFSTDGLHEVAGEVYLKAAGDHATKVFVDLDGDGTADLTFKVILDAPGHLDASDFAGVVV